MQSTIIFDIIITAAIPLRPAFVGVYSRAVLSVKSLIYAGI